MRRSTSLLAAACLAVWAGCSKDDSAKTEGTDQAAGGEQQKAADPDTKKQGDEPTSGDAASLAEKIGVEPGAWEPGEDEGAAAVIASATGTVEVRRVGSEEWEAAAADAKLYEGDQLRTEEGAQATIALPDETVVEVAEASAVAIGSRDATQDPASSVAVLYGVSRFTVGDRAPGEGPFMVYSPAGVVATKGTVYTVGVVASGETRVGVESGEVEVAGGAKLDAPVVLATGKAIVIAPAGELSQPEPVGTADWGTWRDESESKVEIKAAAEFHAARAAALEAELEAAYAELEAQAAIAAEAQGRAEAAEQAADTAAYEAAAPEIGASVDASFAVSTRLHFLTNAMIAHAYVADSLYVRHPEAKVVIEPVRPRLAASVLWNKKYHAVARAHVQPLRPVWYVHHPVGRVRAKLVAYPIPAFYGKVKLAYEPPDVTARVKVPVYRPPVVKARANIKRKIHVTGPRVGWYAGVKTRVRPAPVKVAWYVKPKAPKAKVVFGAKASGKARAIFTAAPPRPRAEAVVRFGGAVKVRDHRGGADVKGAVKGSVPGVKVRDHRADVKGAIEGAGVKVKGGVGGGVDVKGAAGAGVKVRDHRGAGADVKGAVDGAAVKVRDHRADVKGAAGVGVKAGADVKAGAGVKVRDHRKAPAPPPAPKVKAPKTPDPKAKGEVKGSIKVKGGLKIGD